jgi:hypothetical protein
LRSDPSKNTQVLGVLVAQADAPRRMATGQISNVQHRLESLHGGGSEGGFSNGMLMSSASSLRNPDTLVGMQNAIDDPDKRYLMASGEQPGTSRLVSSAPGTDTAPGFWTGRAVNFGKKQPGTRAGRIRFPSPAPHPGSA